jgi:hypothetical protein
LTGVGVAVAIPSSRYWLPREVSEQQSGIYIATSAVDATLLGFMLAALTILLTIGGRRLTRIYVASPLYGKTLALFHGAAVWFGLGTVVALAGLFIDREPTSKLAILPSTSLWIWAVATIGVISVWRFFFSLSVLKDVTNLVVADQKQPTGPGTPPPNQGATSSL